MNTHDADVIIVGSGMGALSAGALLARLHGKKVLVLERHFRAGGFTHTFSRPGGFTWDVGVHYVGELNVPGPMQQALQVATAGELEWAALPEAFDVLRFPGFEFAVRAGRENFRADLKATFPLEHAAIDRFFEDIKVAASLTTLLGAQSLMPAPLHRLAQLFFWRARKLAGLTTREWLETHVRDERLKAVLGARWGDYGPQPRESSFFAHALIVSHYLEGALYPVGGAANILRTTRRVIEAAGGEVRVNSEVRRILVERGRAVGVELATGQQLRAPVIISNAGTRTTFLKLLGPEVPVPFRDELRATPTGMATVSLYLGLSASPASLGQTGANLWLHDVLDQDSRTPMAHTAVFFPSLKDPEARTHTVEVIVPVEASSFAQWAGTRWMKRGHEYSQLKERLALAILARVERDVPGLSRLVVRRELSTPLSTEHFTGHQGGEIYGLPATPTRFTRPYCTNRTLVPGLFLTGADAFVLGIGGTLMSGLMCAAAVAGLRTFSLMQRAARELPRFSCESGARLQPLSG